MKLHVVRHAKSRRKKVETAFFSQPKIPVPIAARSIDGRDQTKIIISNIRGGFDRCRCIFIKSENHQKNSFDLGKGFIGRLD